MAQDRFRTHGQPIATAVVRAMVDGGVPAQAVLVAGPVGVGRTTLALDLAAALLCSVADRVDRPCRTCRTCRMVEHGNHPDLHRLGPEGPGGAIGIGGPGRAPGIRDLIAELALLPVEGGARVAIVEPADRMTEDAQSAFLKTLEEPPASTTIILVAEDEDRLLPTVRSRCVRLRLGTMGVRDVETILARVGGIEAPVAARAARLSGGRPGVALALALAPDAVRLRGEIARTLLDLLEATTTDRLIGVRELAARASEARGAEAQAALLVAGAVGVAGSASASTREPSGRRGRGRAAAPPREAAEGAGDGAEASTAETSTAATRVPAAERRAAALALVDRWREVVRDLVALGSGGAELVRDQTLLEDLQRVAGGLPVTGAARFLHRLETAGERLEGNASPELVLDDLALAWRTSAEQTAMGRRPRARAGPGPSSPA